MAAEFKTQTLPNVVSMSCIGRASAISDQAEEHPSDPYV